MKQIETIDWIPRMTAICEQNKAILGVSVFVTGLFERTICSEPAFCIDTETTHLVMHHLSSVWQRLPKEHEPASAGFLRRTLGGLLQGDRRIGKGSFLSPPLLSMLSTSVREIPFCTLNDEDIWIPSVSIKKETESVHVCLYNVGNYDFVIYLDPFCKKVFPQALSAFCVSINDISFPKPFETSEKWDRAGQMIIWVNRPGHRVILYSSLCSARKSSADPYPDIRYDLASSLSLDTLLAMDEAMQHAIQNFPSSYEACTLSRNNWLVCRAHSGNELYAILDVKHFVTIQDVSVAMEEIEHHFALTT
jgi:hypothetical protein